MNIIKITEAVTKWLAETQGLSLSAQGQMALSDVIANAVTPPAESAEGKLEARLDEAQWWAERHVGATHLGGQVPRQGCICHSCVRVGELIDAIAAAKPSDGETPAAGSGEGRE